MRLDRDIGGGLYLTFATPVLRHVWPGAAQVNARLERLLLRLEREQPEYAAAGGRFSNVQGWRSAPDLLERDEPEIASLREWIGIACDTMTHIDLDRERHVAEGDYTVVAWANVNRHGAYNVAHEHPNNHWSGVYYVSTGEPDPAIPTSGLIEFHDPRPVTYMAPTPGFDFGRKLTIVPEPGMMLLFPSWLSHAVHPFAGRGARISIAFNVRLDGFRIRPRC